MSFDLLFLGGRLLDGAGNPWTRADIGIRRGRIAAVGPLAGARSGRVVDAEGLFICPGFIDMHSHSDLQILANPPHEAKVHQGVTLDVLGQDGLSYAPVDDRVLDQLRRQLRGWNDDPPGFDWSWRSVGEYLDRLDQGTAINSAYLVPHGTLRMLVVGMDDRPCSEEELTRMQAALARGLEEGAVGLSAGLTYSPAMYADDEELVALCEVTARHGGFYAPHHRNYGVQAMEAYTACVEIARRSSVSLHLAHAHLSFEMNRGRASELLALIDTARREGVDVTMDTYPYLVAATYLHALLPGWIQAGGLEATLERLRNPELRERIREEMEEKGSDGFQNVPADWSLVIISGVTRAEHRRFVGMTVAEAARDEGRRPIDFYCELLVQEELGVSCLLRIGDEGNVRTIMTHPAHMAGSDGILVGDRPHPRGWGTFPRYLGRYVRELGVLTWEQAVRKMTSLPAQRLGFLDRGIIRPGAVADVVCFDPDTVRDTATYEEPRSLPEGIPYVAVNGVLVVDEGRHTGELPGRAVRRQGGSA